MPRQIQHVLRSQHRAFVEAQNTGNIHRVFFLSRYSGLKNALQTESDSYRQTRCAGHVVRDTISAWVSTLRSDARECVGTLKVGTIHDEVVHVFQLRIGEIVHILSARKCSQIWPSIRLNGLHVWERKSIVQEPAAGWECQRSMKHACSSAGSVCESTT